MTNIKLTSYGGVESVTGSTHLLKIDNFRLLVDCGLFQGDHENYLRNWEELDFDAKEIDAVILTHAHVDHCGRIPKLFSEGYKGKVYSSAATAELAEIILADNLKVSAQKGRKQGLDPLYNEAALSKALKNWINTDYYKEVDLAPGITFKLHNAGHILGSTMVEINVDGKTIVFTGDIGADDMPLVKSADTIAKADYVIMDSTYGDRAHEEVSNRDQRLLNNLQKAALNKSTLLISVFAVERAQNVLNVLNDYYESHLDFKVPAYLDSPMAINATQVYKRHLELLNDEAQEDLRKDNDLFSFPHFSITPKVNDSKKINAAPPPKVIMAGSGMAEGGRFVHHLAHYAGDERNIILFMGFQVPGTLGYKLINGAFDFDYYGKRIPVKATVDQIDGFSAHADQAALLNWLKQIENKPRKIFLVHGEMKVMESFATEIKNQLNLEAEILKTATTVELV